VSRQSATPKWQELEVGGSIVDPGSARYNRTGDWRSIRPEWDFDKCVKCGVCAIFCPEGCIEMKADGYPHADMEYCKGCTICAVECWTGCIDTKEEEV
jgi:pyruvate ferredoxin oxidoreductase delta subunit